MSKQNVSCVCLQCSRRREGFQGRSIVYFEHADCMREVVVIVASRNVCLEPLTRVHEEETETLIGRIAVSDDRSSTRPSRRETGHIKAILFVNSCPSCCRRV